jgi:hypothetical protein
MRVLIVSEGENELGKANHAGALEALVSRLREDYEEELLFDSITVRHPDLGKVQEKGVGGMCKKALACLRFAERRGFEAVVFVIDQDEDKFKYRRSEVAAAQDSSMFAGIRRAMGVAVLAFDAWMLADEVALASVFGGPVSAQSNPERIGDAKEHFERLKDESGCAKGRSDAYAEVAKLTRIKILEKRCEDGFGVFAERVRKM